MRSLGIDPGTKKAGFAIVERKQNGLLVLERSGVVGSNKRDYIVRLHHMGAELAIVLAEHCKSMFDVACIEAGYVDIGLKRNFKSIIRSSEGRGFLMGIASGYSKKIVTIQATSARSAIGFRRGKASKRDVADFCSYLLYGRPEVRCGDEGDAVALAIASVISGRGNHHEI